MPIAGRLSSLRFSRSRYFITQWIGRQGKTSLRAQLFFCFALASASALWAQSCPAPWATANNVYGTIALRGNYDNGFHIVNEQAYMGLNLVVAAPCAEWFENSSVPIGLMVDWATVDDKQIFPNACGSGSLTYTWSANGAGLRQNSATLDFLTNGYSFLGSTDTVNGNFSEAGCTNTSNAEQFSWGPLDGVPFSGPAPTTAVLSGNTTFTAPSNITGDPATWNVRWNLSPLPDKKCKRCKKKLQRQSGSEIDQRNQSLSEDIPIVGTPFFLHYESDRQLGSAGADAVAIEEGFQFGGWTLSVHHALESLLLSFCFGQIVNCAPYAVVPKALYMGDGETREDADVQTPIFADGKILLTSDDGSEVYKFDGFSFRHLSTVRPMTGANLYTFGFDANGYVVTVTDANGNVTAIQRDANEHPTAIVAPFGEKTALAVDTNGYLSQVTDPGGRVTNLKASATGLLTSLTDPKGNVYSFQYDQYGQLTRHDDPAGGFISLAYADATNGFGVGEKTAMGVSSSYKVVLSNTSTSTTEQYTDTQPDGLKINSTTTQLDGEIRGSTTLPDGSAYSDTQTGDPRWGILAPIDAISKITLGNLTMNATSTRTATLGTPGNPFGLTTQTDTDAFNGRKYTSVFTGSSRTYLDTTPVGRKTTTVLDTLERVSSVQLETLLPVQFVYDSHGRLSTVTQGTRKSTFIYNSNNFLASVTDPMGLTDSFTYDADGNVLTETLADGRVITFTYDANRNLSSLIPPGKTAHTFAYNTVNDVSAYTPPAVAGAGATAYAYDKDHNLTTITRPDTKTITFKYDSAGRLSSAVTPTETINYTYNATTGNLASASIPSGESIAYGYNGPLPISSTWTGTVAGSVSRAFNNNFWVTSQSVNGANTVNFIYDNDGLVTKAGVMTITEDASNGLVTGTTLGGVTDSRTYNTFAELTGYTAKYNTTTLYSVTYTRDADGRIASKTETINGRTTTYAYIYDKAGRLSGVQQNGTTTATYTYDTNSNRLTATTSSATVKGTYDAQDRLFTYGASMFTYTANGELATQKSGTHTTTYTYDVLGNLKTVTLPNGTKLTYLVDPENHRLAKQVNGTQQTGYLYDEDQIAAQLNSSNQIVSQFVYATGANSPDYMVSGGSTYRIISDQLGSPRLVVNTVTGAIAEQMNFDEFGNVLLDSDAGFQPFGFAGGLKDPDTGFVHFGARDYNPSTGRWTAKDQMLMAGGGANLYAYVLNDPVNLVDKTGQEPQKSGHTRVRRSKQAPAPCPCKQKKRRAPLLMDPITIIGGSEDRRSLPPFYVGAENMDPITIYGDGSWSYTQVDENGEEQTMHVLPPFRLGPLCKKRRKK